MTATVMLLAHICIDFSIEAAIVTEATLVHQRRLTAKALGSGGVVEYVVRGSCVVQGDVDLVSCTAEAIFRVES